MRYVLSCAMLVLAAVLSPMDAEAALFAGPLPDDKYITVDELDWAWASPASSFGGFDIDAPGDGWRIATPEEFADRPDASDFIVDDTLRCASGYFTDSFSWCDLSDPIAGFITRDYVPDAGYGVNGVSCDAVPCDIWVVREESSRTAVAAPATLALVLLAVGMLAAPLACRATRTQR